MMELRLARPKEVPLLLMAGYQVVCAWDRSFILLHFSGAKEGSDERTS